MGNYYMVNGLASKSVIQRKGENIFHNNTSASMTSEPTKEMPKYKIPLGIISHIADYDTKINKR